MTRRLPLPGDRRGSLVVMAIVFLFVLGVVILAYHWSSVSTHKMFHHTYYSEKAIALIDGLTAIARGVTQDNLDSIVDLKVGEEKPLTDEVKKLAAELKLIDDDDPEAKKSIKPEIKVTIKMLKKDPFKSPYKTIKADDKEMTGKLEITVEVQFAGFFTEFSSGKRVARSQYEWKKLRAMPPFFRHFALWVKEGILLDEQEDDYAGQNSNFNQLINDRTGAPQQGGAIFVQSHSKDLLGPDKLPKSTSDRKQNPFYDQAGYVYLGGGDGKKKAFLNLTAGGGGGKNTEPSMFGEDFQLYRGENTDFYKVVSTEFDNFLKSTAAQGVADTATASGGRTKLSFRALWDKVKSVFSKVGDFFKKSFGMFADMDRSEGSSDAARSNNLPLYYVVRKDYGYASEWGDDPKYRKFGFGAGKVVSTSLHLYNHRWQNDDPCPTVVLGNVYRRCLSLSGYKQSRGTDNPSTNRPFEVQAGPVEYFKDSNELLKRTTDWSKPEDGGGPVWVWDARVDWSCVEDNKEPDIDGIYIPISGPGLLGRLVPGLRRFWDEDKGNAQKLFMAAIAPPDRMFANPSDNGNMADAVNAQDMDEDQKICQLFVLFDKSKGFEFDIGRIKAAIDNNTIFGALGNKENSPYFEEMLRNFAYSSYYIKQKPELLDSLNPSAKQAVSDAGDNWETLLKYYHPEGESIGENFLAGEIKKRVHAMPADSIADARKKERWAGGKTRYDVFPWSLPDPWANSGSPAAKDNFEKALTSAGASKIFDAYFKPIMTNPGRFLPYNQSLRFWFNDLKDIFNLDADKREETLSAVIPELRDAAFGYLSKAGNDYMKVKQGDATDPPLNDERLAAIFDLRGNDATPKDKTLMGGYFFMDDYGGATKSPSMCDLADIFPGDHYCYEEMDQKQFDDRFLKTTGTGGDGKRTIGLASVVKVKDLSIGNCQVNGGGCIISETTPIKISGNIESKGGAVPLILKAPSFEIDPSVDRIEAMLVCTKEFKFKGGRECVLFGSLIANTWDPLSWSGQAGAMKKIQFNTGFVQDPEHPKYVHNLEPRVRKFVIEGQTQP